MWYLIHLKAEESGDSGHPYFIPIVLATAANNPLGDHTFSEMYLNIA